MDVTDADFKEKVLEKSKDIPVVVDFWASWCMPCQILKPVLEMIAADYDGKFVLAKVNVDQARDTASQYGIKGIPSVKLFKNGEIKDEFTGDLPEKKIREWLDKNL
ncbi:MAG: thioredoxin [archaeon]|nr:MAG: thioredoxin [archaeon]